ncbi:carbohydrate sulfotransferase 11-like [Watersipora subatra]|uniref:carbohydrate sulfotransferase 11-like n=1 Tax=Watersipora subatra TaxID=2589382 RepID=UPI00355BC68E
MLGRICKLVLAVAAATCCYRIVCYRIQISTPYQVEVTDTELVRNMEVTLKNRHQDVTNWCNHTGAAKFIDYESARKNLVGYDWMYTPLYDLFYCSAPKVASTTMKKSLMEALGITVVADTTEIHQQALYVLSLSDWNGRSSMANIPLARSRRNPFATEQPAQHSLIIVRNPYSRLISAYQDKIVNNAKDLTHLRRFCNDYISWDQIQKHLRVQKKNKKVPLVTFSEYIDCVLSNHLLKTPFYNDHIVPMSKLCSVCLIRYDIIVKMESFLPEMEYMLTLLEGDTKELRQMLVKKERKLNPTNPQMSLYRQLNQRQLSQLQLMYHDDFELFGYSTDIPWND